MVAVEQQAKTLVQDVKELDDLLADACRTVQRLSEENFVWQRKELVALLAEAVDQLYWVSLSLIVFAEAADAEHELLKERMVLQS